MPRPSFGRLLDGAMVYFQPVDDLHITVRCDTFLSFAESLKDFTSFLAGRRANL